MSAPRIQAIDPHDEPLLRGWWEVGRDSTAGRPIDAWKPWETIRAAYMQERKDGGYVLVSAFEAGTTVGAGRIFLPLRDNRHLADLDLHVVPRHRRRGIGSALLAELERRAREDGRTTVVGSTHAPVDAEGAGSLFSAARGYRVAKAQETKVVDLATARVAWPALDGEAASRRGEYRVALIEGRIPEEYVEDFCSLLSAFVGEAPTGELDVQREHWTPERLRTHEERMAAIGRVLVIAVAVAPDGHLCGFSDVQLEQADPGHASVGVTLVLPGHRGHRLGLGMKLLTHRRLLEQFPGCAYVETSNAGVNAWMNAVNERLGYRVVERNLGVQKKL